MSKDSENQLYRMQGRSLSELITNGMQGDNPDELSSLRSSLAAAKAEIERLKASIETIHTNWKRYASELKLQLCNEVIDNTCKEALSQVEAINASKPSDAGEAHEREIRNRALEEAAKVAEEEKVNAETGTLKDEAYNWGISDAVRAIRALRSPEPSKGQGEIPK